ncbi:hypothetical protein [Actinomadura oligospora]|uniref:hypothetical protein n=1 Tax=Actinomadura oligospora TaxID=111804 RepID=UPI0012FC1665|nr:hypothetical protein [Actinomadura oligospora]
MECDEGVFLESDRGACTIAGEHGYAWLSRLAPFLTGEHTLRELTGPLSPDRRDLVEKLVGALAEHRFVVDARVEEPHGLSAAEQETYAPEIAFIRYGFDSAERRFERLRQATVSLTGSGPVLAALLRAGLNSGWRLVRLTDVGAEPIDLVAEVAASRRDPDQMVLINASGRIWDDTDVVLQVHDGDRTDELESMATACARHGVALGQLWVRPDEAWMTSVGTADSASSCWRRITGLPQHAAKDDGDWLTGTVPTVLVAQTALSCFEHLTGMTDTPSASASAASTDAASADVGPTASTVTRIDLRTLDTRRHRVYPYSGLHDTSPNVASLPPLAADDLLERVAEYVDARTGVLGTLDSGDMAQSPLRVCQATVSDPQGALPPWSTGPSVIGWGDTASAARLRAVLAGLATYQALAGSQHARAPYAAPIGVAAGLSWPQAVAGALAQHCQVLLRQNDPTDFPAVAAPPDVRVAQLVALLDAAGEQVEIRDLSDVLDLPAYMVGTASSLTTTAQQHGRITMTYAAPACGADPATAMCAALERALLAWQSRTERQPWYADPPSRWYEDDEADDGTTERFADAMTEALARAGHRLTVLPLAHDAQVARLLPFMAQAVTTHA